jgi:chromosome segregation ATPase
MTKEDFILLQQSVLGELSEIIKGYVDAGDAKSATELLAVQEQLGGVEERLDLLDKIDSEDGFDSLVEKYNAIKEMLASEEAVTEVAELVDGVKEEVASLSEEVDAIVSRLDGVEASIVAVSDRVSKTETNIESIEEEIALGREAQLATEKRIDDVISGGTGSLTDVNARTLALEKQVNDVTEEDGTVTKGIGTRLTEVENVVDTAKEELITLVETRTMTDEDLEYLKTSGVCGILNTARGVFGVPLIDCSATEDDNASEL